VLFFNLPMLYGLSSVDGYDGGILPLSQFVTLQQLFLPADDLSTDGRLREKLRFVPPGRLLSLLNTRWIITDKVFDVWIDGIFYDLQFPARLAPGQTISTGDVPEFSATAIGLVSHLEGATELPAGAPAAKVTLTFAGGSQDTFTLKAGEDTAEGSYPANGQAAHPQAAIGVTWPYEAEGVDYITIHALPSLQPITHITVTALLPTGQFVLRGVSLIHGPTTTSRSVLLSTEGHYRQVHSGDVKVYENLDVLPRAYIVHRLKIASTPEEAIAVMKRPQFDSRAEAVYVLSNDNDNGVQSLLRQGQTKVWTPVMRATYYSQTAEKSLLWQGQTKVWTPITRGKASPQDTAAIVSYTPERVEITTHLNSPGWLVLTDTYYPGWQAWIDGQPVKIRPVNILFRAVETPQGRHTVVFAFKPESFWWGAIISSVTLLAVILGLAGLLFPKIAGAG